ncbi:hypothetical protein ABNG02_13760 [Halorubrum ejinorense]|uniref:EamA domain-containing protein n=1 Tax=Halorubrum ejinorense TaxID=425309 RepID=A0ABV4IPB4_9EURY
MNSDIYKLILTNVGIVSIWMSQVGPVLVSKPYYTNSVSAYEMAFLFIAPLVILTFGYLIFEWEISNKVVVASMVVPYSILSALVGFFFVVEYINFISISFSAISVIVGIVFIKSYNNGDSSGKDDKTNQFDPEQHSPERDNKQNNSQIETIQRSNRTAEDINTRRPDDE